MASSQDCHLHYRKIDRKFICQYGQSVTRILVLYFCNKCNNKFNKSFEKVVLVH